MREGAVVADVAAQLRQRDEDLARIADGIGMSRGAERPGLFRQSCGVSLVGEGQSGGTVQGAKRFHHAPFADSVAARSRAAIPLTSR